MSVTLDKVVHLSPDRIERLAQLAHEKRLTEDSLVEKALDLLFGLTEADSQGEERAVWRLMGAKSLERVWDNEADARFDNWKEVYGVR